MRVQNADIKVIFYRFPLEEKGLRYKVGFALIFYGVSKMPVGGIGKRCVALRGIRLALVYVLWPYVEEATRLY